MPKMNARDLAGRLREIRPDIGQLFMSGYTADAIFHEGAMDADIHFIQKPFSLKDLGAKIRDILR